MKSDGDKKTKKNKNVRKTDDNNKIESQWTGTFARCVPTSSTAKANSCNLHSIITWRVCVQHLEDFH